MEPEELDGVKEETPEEGAEIETGEEVEEVSPTDDEDSDMEEAEEIEEPPKKEKSKEDGMKAELARVREAKRELEARLQEIEAQRNAPKEPAPEEEAKFIEAEVLKYIGPKPTRESCNFDDDLYVDAITDWKQAKGEATRELKTHIAKEREYKQESSYKANKLLLDIKTRGEKNFKEDFSSAFVPYNGVFLFSQLDNPDAVAMALGKDEAKKSSVCAALNRGDAISASIILAKIDANVATRNINTKTVKKKPTHTERPGSGGEMNTNQKAVRAARDKAIATGDFTAYLERIGAF